MEVSWPGQWIGTGEPVQRRPLLLRNPGKTRDSIRGQSSSRPPTPQSSVHACLCEPLCYVHPILRVLAWVAISSCASDVLILLSFSSLSSVCNSPHLSPPPLFFEGVAFILFVFSFHPHLSSVHPTPAHTVASPDLSFMSSILVGKTYLDSSLNHFVPR